MKQAAKEVFNLTGVVFAAYPRRAPRRGQVERARRAVQVMYRETQAALRERAIDEVLLFRGVKVPYRDV
jgi:hypothetical protein